MWILLAICAMAVAFYARFLVALYREYRYTRICHLVCIEPTTGEEPAVEARRGKTMSRRAARPGDTMVPFRSRSPREKGVFHVVSRNIR